MSTLGSCLCGTVKFQIQGAFESFFLCHCEYCRKDTGSAHASSLFSSSASLHWLSGQDTVKTYKLPTTRHVKSFCRNCGSALPNMQMDNTLLVVPAGSLNDKVEIKPNAHIFVASKANWDEPLEYIPKLDGLPS